MAFKLSVSDKTSSFGKKPKIKKGYYAGKLIEVKRRTDKEGNPVATGKFGGYQMIFNFEIWNTDEKDTPTKIVEYTESIDGGPEITKPVIIPKFLYYANKDEKTGEMRSAITANSATTKALVALGWTFDSSKEVDMEEFIGKWAEVNIDDYEAKDGDEVYTASTIKDLGKFNGVAPAEPKKVDKETTEKIEEAIDEIDMTDLN